MHSVRGLSEWPDVRVVRRTSGQTYKWSDVRVVRCTSGQMPCCKCNNRRTGSCKWCACVKARRPCGNCLPSKLGRCTNSQTQTTMKFSTLNTPDNATFQPSPSSPPLQPLQLQRNMDSQTANSPSLSNPSDLTFPSPVPPSKFTFTWGTHSSEEFSTILDTVYSEVIHWRNTCFTVPFGRAGK